MSWTYIHSLVFFVFFLSWHFVIIVFVSLHWMTLPHSSSDGEVVQCAVFLSLLQALKAARWCPLSTHWRRCTTCSHWSRWKSFSAGCVRAAVRPTPKPWTVGQDVSTVKQQTVLFTDLLQFMFRFGFFSKNTCGQEKLKPWPWDLLMTILAPVPPFYHSLE